MATFEVTMTPKPGSKPSIAPLVSPRDISASSEVEAMEEAQSLLTDVLGEWSEAKEMSEGPEAAEQFAEAAEDWLLVVRRVDRPCIHLRPICFTPGVERDDDLDSSYVGLRYDYVQETGTQAFDVLADKVICGRLVEGRRGLPGGDVVRVWRLKDATGALSAINGHEWEDHGNPVSRQTFVWPDAGLMGIRADLEVWTAKRPEGPGLMLFV
jgi:hypothetical protein